MADASLEALEIGDCVYCGEWDDLQESCPAQADRPCEPHSYDGCRWCGQEDAQDECPSMGDEPCQIVHITSPSPIG